MLCGLLTPDCGTGTCMGFDIVKESSEIKKQVGYMTQQFSLYEELTVKENLDFAVTTLWYRKFKRNCCFKY